MSEIGFSCSKCGWCCRTLLVEQFGLFLTEDEKTLFDSKYVAPYMALGIDKPSNIIAYQLNQAVCPYINENNNCTIYNKRPLACQSYPIQVTILGSMVEADCPQAKYLQKDGSLMTESGIKANQYIMAKIRKYCKKGSKMWLFNLATKKWTIAR